MLLLDFLLLLLVPILLVLGLILVAQLPELGAWVAAGMGKPAEFWWLALALLATCTLWQWRGLWLALARAEARAWRGLAFMGRLLLRRF